MIEYHAPLRYDKDGEHFYNMISALHKSIRGSDQDAGEFFSVMCSDKSSTAAYWVTRMLQSGQEARVLARRFIRMASEDIGLADNNVSILVYLVESFSWFVCCRRSWWPSLPIKQCSSSAGLSVILPLCNVPHILPVRRNQMPWRSVDF